ncbi:4'-phosphopantetheinyl transferase family protein [Neobacillus drentensis]|uniref:4'-phosphopantetheinyl transferase family protein n=1 Tax=Neobacillus drentensis TaxID=220684 RepID=UPI0028561C54|nr:4'-phosphopantetheinyl transferase superfamily protein [Neobacillus drentensis]MDR7239961.1 4'-phosphopantetheinyl transferase [Neobacillus drentensis]
MNLNYSFLEGQTQIQLTNWSEITKFDQVIGRKGFWDGQEVHVFALSTNASMEVISSLYRKLSQEEKIQAKRFKFIDDQNHYVLSHGFLRNILASYVKSSPSDIRINRAKNGKPFLVSQAGKNSVHFNMAHSENVVLYIVSKSQEVGIDIEMIKPDFDWYSIAKGYFSPQERLFLESLPREDRLKTFYTLWTRKEALLKLSGEGLNGLDAIRNSSYYANRGKTTVMSFNFDGNYLGTLAVEVSFADIHFFCYSAFNA